MGASKWTPERREAFGRVVEAARRFVRTADEFGDDHPEACGEDMEALVSAIDAEGRAWDDGPFESVFIPHECDPGEPVVTISTGVVRATRTG